jgi:anti-sigma factor RsiW
MPCRQFEDLILEYCENALVASDRARVEEHVAACAACRAFLEVQSEIDAALPAAIGQPAPSPGFRERVMRRIECEDEEPVRWLPLALDAYGYTALAAMGGVLLVTLFPPAYLAWMAVGLSVGYGWWLSVRLLRER